MRKETGIRFWRRGCRFSWLKKGKEEIPVTDKGLGGGKGMPGLENSPCKGHEVERACLGIPCADTT